MQTRAVHSDLGGLEMDLPAAWKIAVDGDVEKLIFAFDFYQGDYSDYVAVRAEQFSLNSLLRGELYEVPDGTLTPSSWADVIRAPVRPEDVALWIMRHKSRSVALQQGALQGAGGRAVPASDESGASQVDRKDAVVDARVLDGGAAEDWRGSALVFHVRTTVANREAEDGAVFPSRYWSVKALLRNGTVSVGYVTANEAHFLPGATGPMDGPCLDGMAGSLRLLPQQA